MSHDTPNSLTDPIQGLKAIKEHLVCARRIIGKLSRKKSLGTILATAKDVKREISEAIKIAEHHVEESS